MIGRYADSDKRSELLVDGGGTEGVLLVDKNKANLSFNSSSVSEMSDTFCPTCSNLSSVVSHGRDGQFYPSSGTHRVEDDSP